MYHSGLNVSNANASLTSYLPSSLERLSLSACSITEIPGFLRTQRRLWELDLSSNKIRGPVPKWLWELPELGYLNLSHNSLSHLEGSPKVLAARSVWMLDLSSNVFQGPLPAPPTSTQNLLLSANNFSGSIPPAICKLNSLETLDLSNNNFSGLIPRCLGNVSDSISVVSLRNNNLSGSLPDTFIRCGNLQTLDVGHNKLAGKLPRSLLNCTDLEVLNVESNGISDTYPFWLEDLQWLQILVLRSNGFHGPLVSSSFSKLQIIDVSHNNFFGALPPDYFANWSVMSSIKTNEDNSKLRLSGKIPPELGDIARLERINLSHNQFTGTIPQGPQFVTQDSSSFEGNPRLCGRPLQRTCDANTSPARPNQKPEREEEVMSWIAVVIGYIPRLVFGLTVGHIMASYKREYFLKAFGLNRRRHIRTR